MFAIAAPDRGHPATARMAGVTLILSIAIVILANYGINFRLIVPGNAVETARNLLAHPTLFRLNLALNLAYVACQVAFLASACAILARTHTGLALTAAGLRLMYAMLWAITALHSLEALRLLGDTNYLQTFPVNQLQALARLNLASSDDAYYVALPFWGLSSTLFSLLWLRSRLVPRPLAWAGLLASAWCAFCAFAFLVHPRFEATVGASWFDVPILLFELGLGGWLAVKGLGPQEG